VGCRRQHGSAAGTEDDRRPDTRFTHVAIAIMES
jgi:hypothetical protein